MTRPPKSKHVQTATPLPTKQEVLDFIKDSPGRIGKREIARAFNIKAGDKAWLRAMLRELANEGAIEQGLKRRFHKTGHLPEVTVVDVREMDDQGELIARPAQWTHESPPPRIRMVTSPKDRPALAPGHRVLARLRPTGENRYEGRVIRVLPSAGPREVLGVYRVVEGEGRIQPTDKKLRTEFMVDKADRGEAEPGDLVLAEVLPARRRYGLREARITARLGSMTDPNAISRIAIHDHDIPHRFPEAVLRDADAAKKAPMSSKGHKRVDLRKLPLVTIDGADARDFDDAVWAGADDDPKNPGGWHLIVAIADVAWYVRPDAPLDREARLRGNSVYFADRVVPMLPEALSNGWCSLNPREDRPCMVAHLWIDSAGKLVRHRFERAMMNSAARLTYEQVQQARDGQPDDTTGPLLETVISPLYGAYDALAKDQKARGVLELDLPERQVILDDKGHVEDVKIRDRFDSHRLIEAFMICANVAAAETLEAKRMPCMYRIHEQPADDKLDSLREFLETIDLNLPKGRVTPVQFNRLLHKAAGTPHHELVNQVVLRSQSQAVYSPENVGHFGLSLRRYAHFTSPIRRYADLLVHRALITALNLGDGGLGDHWPDMEETGEHISATERRAMAAERDTVDRYLALWLSEHVGTVLDGRIGGVTRFGLFVTLDHSGGDGLVPLRDLGDDYYHLDEASRSLIGEHTGRRFSLGDRVKVKLHHADPITGSALLEMIEGAQDDDVPTRLPRGKRTRGKGNVPGRVKRARNKAATGKKGGKSYKPKSKR